MTTMAEMETSRRFTEIIKGWRMKLNTQVFGSLDDGSIIERIVVHDFPDGRKLEQYLQPLMWKNKSVISMDGNSPELDQIILRYEFREKNRVAVVYKGGVLS